MTKQPNFKNVCDSNNHYIHKNKYNEDEDNAGNNAVAPISILENRNEENQQQLDEVNKYFKGKEMQQERFSAKYSTVSDKRNTSSEDNLIQQDRNKPKEDYTIDINTIDSAYQQNFYNSHQRDFKYINRYANISPLYPQNNFVTSVANVNEQSQQQIHTTKSDLSYVENQQLHPYLVNIKSASNDKHLSYESSDHGLLNDAAEKGCISDTITNIKRRITRWQNKIRKEDLKCFFACVITSLIIYLLYSTFSHRPTEAKIFH